MRALIQRVKQASVTVEGDVVGRIGAGLLVLLGIAGEDSPTDAAYLVDKSVNLRIFEDKAGKMNLSLQEIHGEVLVVSQFTLLADCRKGRRPSFAAAADPEQANSLYQAFVSQVQELGVQVATGRFQAHMEVALINDGPVTILLDSKRDL